MENLDYMIEKYKRDMINMSSRARIFNDEPNVEIKETEKYTDEEKPVENEENGFEEAVEAVAMSNEEEQGDDEEDSYGYLKIRAYTGNDAYPVETAYVRVFDDTGNLVFEGYTDQSGIIEGIRLKTVNERNSEAPNDMKKSINYRIVVTHPDFTMAEYENVPIFDGVESIQPVDFEISGGERRIVNETGNYPGEDSYGN